MHALALPKANLRLSKKDEKLYVWCIIRKKTLVLTPEEWVRQHIIHFLIHEKNTPLGLIASEKGLNYHGFNRRCDLVIYSNKQLPVLLVECKAPDVAITEKVFHQIAHYNFKLKVNYLMMTNGIQHVICRINHDTNSFEYLETLPNYETYSKL